MACPVTFANVPETQCTHVLAFVAAAFPEDVEIQRLGLGEAVAQVKAFLTEGPEQD